MSAWIMNSKPDKDGVAFYIGAVLVARVNWVYSGNPSKLTGYVLNTWAGGHTESTPVKTMKEGMTKMHRLLKTPGPGKVGKIWEKSVTANGP